ncbi:hypothetical protein MBCUT_18060 [Methanobrevibacter cuticularis]|uniref:Uncharacterized protein n=1 Tax=Methanobrevibacter cuticularis TaxID=47311 RepID=A0A166CYP8_9EURY|nr:hypothetical protein [Methanobrevibacter cuticularis]KZX15004.1 hypothetical protein MBCUT_18060 [Methanobrevibacter cuticularis]
MKYTCGESPGHGEYRCLTNNCPEIISLDDTSDKLPPCRLCNKCNWERV